MWHKKYFLLASLTCLSSAYLVSCAPATNSPSSGNQGNLSLVANGEDFVRQGFVSRDGWQINFDHLYVTLDEVIAYQGDDKTKPSEEVVLVGSATTVDLAAGNEDADPIFVNQTKNVSEGTYNALAWKLVQSQDDSAQGYTIVMDGKAAKNDQTVDFVIKVDQPQEYTCGEFVGDERKGIVKGADTAEVEVTLHFDHIFGDAEAPADDHINTKSLGFAPLAALAEAGKLEVDTATLKTKLSNADYQTFSAAVAGLGHVGEGHCD